MSSPTPNLPDPELSESTNPTAAISKANNDEKPQTVETGPFFWDAIILFLSALHFLFWAFLTATSTCLELVNILSGKEPTPKVPDMLPVSPGPLPFFVYDAGAAWQQWQSPQLAILPGTDDRILYYQGYTPGPPLYYPTNFNTLPQITPVIHKSYDRPRHSRMTH